MAHKFEQEGSPGNTFGPLRSPKFGDHSIDREHFLGAIPLVPVDCLKRMINLHLLVDGSSCLLDPCVAFVYISPDRDFVVNRDSSGELPQSLSVSETFSFAEG